MPTGFLLSMWIIACSSITHLKHIFLKYLIRTLRVERFIEAVNSITNALVFIDMKSKASKKVCSMYLSVHETSFFCGDYPLVRLPSRRNSMLTLIVFSTCRIEESIGQAVANIKICIFLEIIMQIMPFCKHFKGLTFNKDVGFWHFRANKMHKPDQPSILCILCCCCLPCNHCSNGYGLLQKFWLFK